MKEINEHLESTPPRWDADLGRWIEPGDDFDETPVTVANNATNETRGANEGDNPEFVNLYHLARTAGKQSRYDRMLWACDQFKKANPQVNPVTVYKQLCRALA